MTVILNLEPALEQQLQKQAKQMGLAIDQFIVSTLEEKTNASSVAKALPDRETILLQKINQGFSASFWEKYHVLIKERQNETISSENLNELIKMTEEVELANVKRLENLVELAQIRQVPLVQLMVSLGIQSPGCA